MLYLKIDRRLIIEYVHMKMSKDLKLKDLFNLQASDKTDWATVSTKSKEMLEKRVRNYIVGQDEDLNNIVGQNEEVLQQLPTFKTLKSLKKRSKGYHRTSNGNLVEVVLPDTASSRGSFSSRSGFSPRSSFSPRSGFSPLGPMASAVLLNNFADPSPPDTNLKYLTIGGEYCLGQASVQKNDKETTPTKPPMVHLKRVDSFDSVDTEYFFDPDCKEEMAAPFTSDSEENNPEPLLQTSTQCLPDYIVQLCEEGEEEEQLRDSGPPRRPSPIDTKDTSCLSEEVRAKTPRKRRRKSLNYACKLCPRKYGRLLQLQMAVFKAQRRKLLEEIAILKLKRRKLRVEVEQMNKIQD
jgi:hypothetical protein